MRWYSTVESAENLEFSVLSAIESVMAVSLSIWIAWEYHSVLHIIIATVMAPLLLLRTEESTERGLKVFSWIYGNFNFDKNFTIFWLGAIGVGIISIPIYFFFGISTAVWITIIILLSWLFFLLNVRHSLTNKLSTLLEVIGVVGVVGATVAIVGVVIEGSLIAKFIATLQTLFTSPIKTLKEIPKNWFRIVFSMDSIHPPEILPGIENLKYDNLSQSIDDLKFKTLTKGAIKDITKDNAANKIFKIMLLLLTPLLYLPALAYRWSLKSSSLIWLPLIWIIGSTSNKAVDINKQLSIQLDSLRKSAWAKITTVYAFMVVFPMTLLPLVLKGKASELSDKLGVDTGGVILDNILNFFLAFQIQAWHWSRLLVALLTLFTFFYADKLIRKRKFSKNAGINSAPYLLRTLNLLRIPLSLFTIGCGFYLLFNSIDWQEQFHNMQWLPFKGLK